MQTLLGFALVALIILHMGCSTPATLESKPINMSLNAINSAVESALSMGIRGYSENHREVYSKPFQIVQSPEISKRGYHDRGIAKVLILGDQRPYTIEVHVAIERGKKTSDGDAVNYKLVRYDQELGQKLLSSILDSLHKRNQDKNLIDDFKSF
jgi:hypothetical protein